MSRTFRAETPFWLRTRVEVTAVTDGAGAAPSASPTGE